MLTQYFDAYSGDFDDSNPLNLEWAKMYRGSNEVIQERCVYFTITLDYATKAITTKTKCYLSGTGKAATDGEFHASMSSDKPLGSFAITGNINNNGRYSTLDNLKITTTEGDYSAATANYTVNWVCGEDVLKTETRSGDVDESITLLSSDYSSFTQDSQKYIYVSDDASSKTVSGDGSAAVTITVREAEVWTYYVKAFEGSTELITISTNTIVEGESASYGYPQYIAVNGVLYKATAQSGNPWWGESYTMTENNAVRGFQYAKEGNESIVFCSEAEDIDGLSVVSGGNTDIRASNRKGAYATEETVVTTLEPGIYRVFGACYGNAGTTFTLKAGNATVFTVATNGNPSHTTGDAFLITETTDLVMPKAGNGGSSPKIMDYIIVQKAGEYYESMSIVGDFSDGAWDATKGIEMTRDAENPYVWTAVVNDFVITSSKLSYDYKAVANSSWDGYVLPSGGTNQNYNFDYSGAGAGTYRLTFTVNTQEHSVELAILKMDENTYTVAGSEAIFGTNWDTTDTDNDMTRNSDNSFTWTKSNVELAADTYEYKVVQNHSWDVSYPSSNAQIEIKDAGTYDITITYLNGAVSHAIAVQKIITVAGYATYCSSYDLDFSEVEGLTAYYANKDESNNVTFNKVSGAKAKTGLLLKGAKGTYSIPMKECSTTIENNALVGVTADTSVDAGAFVLMNGEYGVGFYKTTKAFTVGANTAYLPASVSARSFIGFEEDGETTGVSEALSVKGMDTAAPVYNLQGQRVNAPQRGLFIQNGKKYIVK